MSGDSHAARASRALGHKHASNSAGKTALLRSKQAVSGADLRHIRLRLVGTEPTRALFDCRGRPVS